MNTIDIVIDNTPSAHDDAIIRNGIIEFNQQVMHEQAQHFSVFAKDNHQIIGGALVWEHTDALYIDVLWFETAYRQQGLGSQIILSIESVAHNKNITKIFVDTYAFQAQAFYEKNGFYVIGIIPDYLLGASKIFLRKDIKRCTITTK